MSEMGPIALFPWVEPWAHTETKIAKKTSREETAQRSYSQPTDKVYYCIQFMANTGAGIYRGGWQISSLYPEWSER